MNVYDFDGTIYDGDSSIDFFIYTIKHKPYIIKYVPKQIMGFILYGLKKINKVKLKEYFFSFLQGIDTEAILPSFWEHKKNKIFNWYIKQKTNDDIIISASPEFLLKPVCEYLKVGHLIASKVNPSTGLFTGDNCRGAEKVKRLKDELNINHIDNFYSDSLSDLPLANIADNAFMIKNGIITKWRNNDFL